MGETRWSSILGAAVSACFAVLVLTGVALMTAYAPSPQSAWASVHYIQYGLAAGWIVRGTHWWAAQALLAVATVHVAHGALAGSYRRPREISWWLSLLVIALALGGAITGGLLPWDQRGWWARVVEGNIVGLAPVLGTWIQQMMMGGTELGALGLTRAHTMHVILLPAALGAVLWGRYLVARKAGSSQGAISTSHASAALRDVLVASVVVVGLAVLAWASRGAPLDAPADPMSEYPARPEWFLLTLFQLRKFFHGAGEFWGTSLLPAAAGAYLALLPWIDSPPHRPGRLVVMAPVLVIFVGAVGLGVVARIKDAHDAQYRKQRARADALAAAAAKLAMAGVPPAGALDMMRRDPELRGRDLFAQHCAACHVLGDLGDPKKATAAKLDDWGTPVWIAAMIHDPDAPGFFGRGPYKGEMPSVDVRPKNKAPSEPWKPMIKGDAEKSAVVAFLAAQGDEPSDPARPTPDPSTLDAGEKIVSQRCSACHLYKGEGDDEGTGLAPELSRYGSLSWTRAQIANPANAATYREGALDESRKKHMPRFDIDIAADDIDLVARWTRAHARGISLP